MDKNRGLTGTCDYLMTRARELFYLRGPLFVATAARRDDPGGGLGPCAAQMVAVRMFNDKDKTPLDAVYGCVTSGNNWRFLKLDGDTLTIDKTEYHIQNVAAVLGVLVEIRRRRPAGVTFPLKPVGRVAIISHLRPRGFPMYFRAPAVCVAFVASASAFGQPAPVLRPPKQILELHTTGELFAPKSYLKVRKAAADDFAEVVLQKPSRTPTGTITPS